MEQRQANRPEQSLQILRVGGPRLGRRRAFPVDDPHQQHVLLGESGQMFLDLRRSPHQELRVLQDLAGLRGLEVAKGYPPSDFLWVEMSRRGESTEIEGPGGEWHRELPTVEASGPNC